MPALPDWGNIKSADEFDSHRVKVKEAKPGTLEEVINHFLKPRGYGELVIDFVPGTEAQLPGNMLKLDSSSTDASTPTSVTSSQNRNYVSSSAGGDGPMASKPKSIPTPSKGEPSISWHDRSRKESDYRTSPSRRGGKGKHENSDGSVSPVSDASTELGGGKDRSRQFRR